MVEIKVCQMLKMQNSNYGFTVETKKVKNLTMPFVQKLVRKSFDHSKWSLFPKIFCGEIFCDKILCGKILMIYLKCFIIEFWKK